MAAAPVLPKLVGQRVKRREDPRLIQGRGTYVDDVKIVGMQHLAFKRSDIAHGRIRSIDTSDAEAMEGVEAVFTGAQIAAFLAPMPIGTPFPSPAHHAVAVDTVRFVGDPVAVVVANDRYVARDAADAIVVEYEPLPAVVDPEQAMAGQSAVLHADFPNNVALGPLPSGTGVGRRGAVDDTAVDAAFEAAEVVIAQRMVNQRLAPNSIEARGVVAHYEPGREALTIWSSTQNPHILRTFVARMLGLGEDRVRAIAPEVGGGFGAKINIYGEEYVAAALSKRLGVPIKWIEDRSEAFLATVHGRDLIAYVELAATRDGKVLGLRMRIIADIGAYNMLLTAGVPTNSMTMANATYVFPAIRATLTEVFTNKTPTDAYRGAGRPEAAYFVERAMDMLARELEMDPAELRRKNFIQPDQFPYKTHMGAVYDSGDYEKALDHALTVSGWEQLKRERDAARADGRLVGLGLSMYVEICGMGPSSTLPQGGLGARPGDRRARRADQRHDRGCRRTGRATRQPLPRCSADQFGVPLEHVTIHHGDTAVVKQGIGTFGSRSQAVGGAALHLAGTARSRRRWQSSPRRCWRRTRADLVFENGRHHGQGRTPRPPRNRSPRWRRSPTGRPGCPEGLDPGAERRGVLRAERTTPTPSAATSRCWKMDRDTGEPRLLKHGCGRRRRQPDQSADRRGPDTRRAGAGHRAGAGGRGRLRRRRPAADRLVHGLRAFRAPATSRASSSTTP